MLQSEGFLHQAWTIANLYLGSIDADLLGEQAPRIAGLSQETTCFVSLRYFEEDDPFADFVVHEAAHIFHNCKRATLRLPHMRRREWLLEIAFQKRETFAYACEAYSRIVERKVGSAERAGLVEQYAAGPMPSDESVAAEEVVDILRAAVGARNGWKKILERCGAHRR